MEMGPKRKHPLWVDYSEILGSGNQAESMATRNNKVCLLYWRPYVAAKMATNELPALRGYFGHIWDQQINVAFHQFLFIALFEQYIAQV